jgi:hypothetical protein
MCGSFLTTTTRATASSKTPRDEVYFSHEVVENRFGFDDLRKGQQLEYTLENAPYFRAASVRVAPAVAAILLRPAA